MEIHPHQRFVLELNRRKLVKVQPSCLLHWRTEERIIVVDQDSRLGKLISLRKLPAGPLHRHPMENKLLFTPTEMATTIFGLSTGMVVN